MFGFQSDLESVTKQRQKMQNEIDDLLSNQQTTIQDIFAIKNQEKQDEIINQLSVANKKAVKFFTNEERLNELISLITEMPPENCTHERGHRYPFLANQVFSDGGDGVAEIIDRFFYSYKINDSLKASQSYFGKDSNKYDSSQSQTHENKLNEKPLELNQSPFKMKESNQENQDDNSGNQNKEDQKLIFQNIQNIVDLLSGGQQNNQANNQNLNMDDQFEFEIDQNNNIEFDQPAKIEFKKDEDGYEKDEEFNFQQIIEKFENPKNVKKSFELKYKNDDDDEIYFTNDEEENGEQNDDQDMFFQQPNFIDLNQNIKSRKFSGSPPGGFEKIEFTAKDLIVELNSTNGMGEEAILNPFKDTLANSDILPKTIKLDVQIHENYLDNSQSLRTFTQILNKQQQYKTQSYIDNGQTEDLKQNEKDENAMTSQHQENILKRKRKKQNLSLYHFDEATQKSIAETVEKERQNILVDIDDNQKNDKIHANTMKLPLVSIVENHIKNAQNENTEQQQNKDQQFQVVEDDFGEFNDRELPAKQQDKQIIQEIQEQKQEPEDEEEDNILRSMNKNKMEVKIKVNETEENIYNPTNIFGFEKYEEVNSIEIECVDSQNQEQLKKEQDYKLIDKFFSFMDKKDDEPLNATLCGYFCQVCLIMISRVPVEMFKYIQSTHFILFDRMIEHIDNKSISDLFVRVFNEVIKYLTHSQESVVQCIQDQKQSDLQQSGQSVEKISVKDQQKNEENLIKIGEVIIKILDLKMDESANFMEKLGAIDILLELLKNQLCYQTLTTKKAFEIMTKFLVSDDEDCQRHVYILLKNLIQNYEKHERFQKRINIDNFEDDELLNSHSGSGSGFLNKSKKSKNSKKQNQDVMKEIQESDLFQYIRVVVRQITCQEIEKKFEQINAAKQSGIYQKLGMHFLSLIEFLEKASSIFSGFSNDINQTLVETDVFNQIFEIVKYYSNSDILNRTVLKIVQNVIQSKCDDAQNMVRYMIEDTIFVQFLIENGPKCQIQVQELELLNGKINDDETEAQSNNNQENIESQIQKSPEQSQRNKNQNEVSFEKTLKGDSIVQKMQISQSESKALQAHIKQICDLMTDHQKLINNQNNLSDIANSKADVYNQSQSGEQSKSSEIIIETEDDQINTKRVSKIIATNLNENQEWNLYVKTYLEPIQIIQKGKLCEDLTKDGNQSGTDSENNIFDHDFMTSVEAINTNDKQIKNNQINSDFQLLDIEVANLKNDQELNSQDKKTIQSNNFIIDEEVEDHKKFFQKMQKCFSNNVNKNRRNSNCVDNDERDMKQTAYQNHFSDLHNDLRASLSDQPVNPQTKRNGRDRSTSNDNFNLPPLPEFDQDVNNSEDADNYKSNNKLSQSSVPTLNSDIIDSKLNQNIQQFDMSQDLKINEDDVRQEQFGSQQQRDIFSNHASYNSSINNIEKNDGQKKIIEQDFLKNFEDFAFELMNEEKKQKYDSNNSEEINIQNSQYAIKSNQCENDDNQSFQSMEDEDQNSQIFQEKDEIGQIFDQINQFDKLYDIMDDDCPEQNNAEKESEQVIQQDKKDSSPDFFKDLEIYQQQNDNFDEYQEKLENSQNQLADQKITYQDVKIKDEINKKLQRNNDEDNENCEDILKESSLHRNEKSLLMSQVFIDHNKIEINKNDNILSKSVCLSNKSEHLEINPEFQDNLFWKLQQQQIIDIDELILDLQ